MRQVIEKAERFRKEKTIHFFFAVFIVLLVFFYAIGFELVKANAHFAHIILEVLGVEHTFIVGAKEISLVVSNITLNFVEACSSEYLYAITMAVIITIGEKKRLFGLLYVFLVVFLGNTFRAFAVLWMMMHVGNSSYIIYHDLPTALAIIGSFAVAVYGGIKITGAFDNNKQKL